MRLHEIRDLNADDLKAQIIDTRKEIVGLRFQLAALKLTNPAKLRGARRHLSRLLTIEGENARKNQKEQSPKAQGAQAKAKDRKASAKSAVAAKQ